MNQPYPRSFDSRSLRDALGEFATGVTVMTACAADGQPVGVTVNSFASVSLDPPLVLWSLGRQSEYLAAFETSSHFAVNVLAADQMGLSLRFSQTATDNFLDIDWQTGAGGVPLLAGCCAWLECRGETRHPGGDHVILVGRVENIRRAAKPPLIFHGGLYRSLR